MSDLTGIMTMLWWWQKLGNKQKIWDGEVQSQETKWGKGKEQHNVEI
jgi:hypothetical protein